MTKGKDTAHFDNFIESLQNIERGMETAKDANEFAKRQVSLNDALDNFIKIHTLYFNQRYYVKFEGNNDKLSKTLGLSEKGDEDGKDSE